MQSFNTFVGQSLRHFIKVGSLVPSSKYLARRMVKGVRGPVIVELGPGTGVFTKEILSVLPENGLLISIESNETFVKYIEERIHDSRLRLYTGDALMLKSFLKKNDIDKVDYIISGLPIGTFKKSDRNILLREISESLTDEGVYVQFEYFLAGIVSVKKVFKNVSIAFELFNFPPAFVMRCKKSKK